MEFIELIKVPKLDNVIITLAFKDPMEGSICITGHHLIFSSRKAIGDEVWVSLMHADLMFDDSIW
jgi:myotubularin-related protein 9